MSKLKAIAAQASVFALLLLSGSAAFGQGTGLSVSVSAETGVCVNSLSPVTVNYTITSTGAADAATVGYSVNAGAVVGLPGVAGGLTADGGGWTKGNGSNKTATGQFIINLANGDYDIEVCAEQNGADKKSDCSSVHVQVACAQVDKCDQAAVRFGEVVGNKNLCKSDARINVQLKGLFGANAVLEVKDGNGGTVQTLSTSRNGDSCVYHWNLDPKTWIGAQPPAAGLYMFTVTGDNSASYVFSADLVCSTPKK
jgi:hypothetical protein